MKVKERFLKYVSFDTQSDENSVTVPSTEKQKKLGAYLAEELSCIGLINTEIDKNGYVYGYLPATDDMKTERGIGFIAHMDTSPDVSGKDVCPRTIKYKGGDIRLSDTVTISEKEFPFLRNYVSHELITTDGTTLLGADDKAGIAEIFTACEELMKSGISHRAVSVCITPDEEIGRGTEHFDFSKFEAKAAYTVDGLGIGEIEYENFNAAGAVLKVHGVNIHPGSAKNKMKNACLMANHFISLLPPSETPAHTEGYEGFFHVTDICGNESEARISLLVRDHDREKFEERKQFLHNSVDYLKSIYGNGCFELEIKDSYYNMKEKIMPYMWLIDDAKAAMEKFGVSLHESAIRGGTDGASLSYMGLPCPNLPTGGENAHSVREFVSVDDMKKMVCVLTELAK